VNVKEYVVRVIKPAPKPSLPQTDQLPDVEITKKKNPLGKTLSFLAGSSLGIAAGLTVYFMLKAAGAEFGGAETSFIIGLPSVLGILTSFATH
jgi:hypothetical protein